MFDVNIRLHIVLDNIRSVFNVGSVFRTADAVGGCKLYLCGMTATPEVTKMLKTSLGAEKSVPWEYFTSTIDCIKQLKTQNIQVFAVELTSKSENFQKIKYPSPVALVFGHEINGVNQNVLEICDKTIMVPMAGIKESLNVSTTAGIVMYEAIREK